MLLGFIPGVGAMYNGQFVKGFIHVVIFVLLILAIQDISGLFGILLGFFVFYMAFDAYKTAEAKRLGLPLPDALGLNRMFGMHEGHSAYVATPQEAQFSTSPMQPSSLLEKDHANNGPTGAIVLIVLGVLFLVTTLTPLHIGKLWPLLLIGLGLWIAYQRTIVRG